MGTELTTNMVDHSAKQYWGGIKRGVCLQITASSPDRIRDNVMSQIQEEGFIQLTMEEAVALRNTLDSFIIKEAKRRQELLREQIKDLKDKEKTVFNEVANIPETLLHAPSIAIDMVSKFCPKTRSNDG